MDGTPGVAVLVTLERATVGERDLAHPHEVGGQFLRR
jgi:hypothetical protein